MKAVATLKDEDFGDAIVRHIRECDRMYREVYGRCSDKPECNACKKLLKMGFELTDTTLPELCIRHCERWNLPDKLPKPPNNMPNADGPIWHPTADHRGIGTGGVL
jgi:hypothetical protein